MSRALAYGGLFVLALIALTGCPIEDPPEPFPAACSNDDSECCSGGECQAGGACQTGRDGTAGFCGGNALRGLCWCTSRPDGLPGDGGFIVLEPDSPVQGKAGEPLPIVGGAQYRFVPPEAVAWPLPESLAGCDEAVDPMAVEFTGHAVVRAVQGATGQLDLELLDSTLGANGFYLGCMGETGHNAVEIERLVGVVDPADGFVSLRIEGRVTNDLMPWGTSLRFRVREEGTVDRATGALNLRNTGFQFEPALW